MDAYIRDAQHMQRMGASLGIHGVGRRQSTLCAAASRTTWRNQPFDIITNYAIKSGARQCASAACLQGGDQAQVVLDALGLPVLGGDRGTPADGRQRGCARAAPGPISAQWNGTA